MWMFFDRGWSESTLKVSAGNFWGKEELFILKRLSLYWKLDTTKAGSFSITRGHTDYSGSLFKKSEKSKYADMLHVSTKQAGESFIWVINGLLFILKAIWIMPRSSRLSNVIYLQQAMGQQNFQVDVWERGREDWRPRGEGVRRKRSAHDNYTFSRINGFSTVASPSAFVRK